MQSSHKLAGPGKGNIHRICFKFLIVTFESPDLFARIIEITPPAESNQKPASHILDCPEIQGSQYGDEYENLNFAQGQTEKEIAGG